ncbi:MAG: hypothetical protein JSS99_10125 [Actinobacteria bacterium]|nr:hypothetical protein [Actinomycetota bacterium]
MSARRAGRFAAMWLVCGATVLLSLVPTRALARRVDDHTSIDDMSE